MSPRSVPAVQEVPPCSSIPGMSTHGAQPQRCLGSCLHPAAFNKAKWQIN